MENGRNSADALIKNNKEAIKSLKKIAVVGFSSTGIIRFAQACARIERSTQELGVDKLSEAIEKAERLAKVGDTITISESEIKSGETHVHKSKYHN